MYVSFQQIFTLILNFKFYKCRSPRWEDGMDEMDGIDGWMEQIGWVDAIWQTRKKAWDGWLVRKKSLKKEERVSQSGCCGQ